MWQIPNLDARVASVGSLPGVTYWLERCKATPGDPCRGGPDHAAGQPERGNKIDRIEVQAQACHQIIPIRKDLGPLTVQESPIGQNPGHSKLLDKGVAVDADHPGSELDSLHMSEHPVEPTAHTGMPVKAHPQQLHGAILGEACHDPIQIAGLERLVEFNGGLTN